MKAMILKEFGGIENLKIEEIDKPLIKDGEVLVKTKSISINPVDIKTRQGFAQADNIRNEHPMILGWDISGVIVEKGKNVKNFDIGDKVFGMVNFPGHGKAYTEYVAAPVSQIAIKPENISDKEAAAATLAALTAWKAIVTFGRVKKGDKVLIHGASGGVGHYAVQIAKHFGAIVTATASGNNKDFVMQLGTDEFIDYKTQRFEEIVPKMDLIIDSVGGENFAKSTSVLKPEGVIVNLPTNKAEEAEKIAKEKDIKNFYQMLVESNGDDMKSIAKLLSTNSIKSFIDKKFSFEEIPQAHTAIESGNVVGKIVVTMD